MTTTRDETVGAAVEPRPPSRPSLRTRLENFNARIPYRAKLIAAYAVIAILLIVAFSLVQFDTAWMREHAWNIIRYGLPLTLLICAGAITLATILATFGALMRISHNALANAVAGFYTSFFRGTPLLVQLFLIYFALPEIGIRLAEAGYPAFQTVFVLSPVQTGILALGLNYGAYMTEIFRAGIQSVGHGQGEAADALGMTYRQKMRRVVLPQAVRVIIPPTGNEFIAMLKDSALVYTIGALELFRRADLAGRADFRSLEAYLIAAGMYWALTSIFSFFQARLERRMGRGYDRAGETAAMAAAAQPGVSVPTGDPAPVDWEKGGLGAPAAPQQPHEGGPVG